MSKLNPYQYIVVGLIMGVFAGICAWLGDFLQRWLFGNPVSPALIAWGVGSILGFLIMLLAGFYS